jgi:DNA-binding YbaB/EbfC family protein
MPKQPNMNDLMKQATKLQEQLLAAQQAAAEQVVEGHAGGGVVKVTVTGGSEFLKVEIDPSAVDPDDVGMLEDLVLAAIHDAMGKVHDLTQQAMGGFDPGGLGGLLG